MRAACTCNHGCVGRDDGNAVAGVDSVLEEGIGKILHALSPDNALQHDFLFFRLKKGGRVPDSVGVEYRMRDFGMCNGEMVRVYSRTSEEKLKWILGTLVSTVYNYRSQSARTKGWMLTGRPRGVCSTRSGSRGGMLCGVGRKAAWAGPVLGALEGVCLCFG
jgi:hypothetical protein